MRISRIVCALGYLGVDACQRPILIALGEEAVSALLALSISWGGPILAPKEAKPAAAPAKVEAPKAAPAPAPAVNSDEEDLFAGGDAGAAGGAGQAQGRHRDGLGQEGLGR